MIILETERDLGIHQTRVTDGKHLPILGVPAFLIPLPRLATVEGTEKECFFADDISLMDNFILSQGLLTMGEYNPARYIGDG